MSIPLDRLYNYLDSLLDEDTIIYRFFPHGSKNLNDLDVIKPYDNRWIKPYIICHDQEPLNYDYYTIKQNVQPAVDRIIKYHRSEYKILPDWYYSTVVESQDDLLASNLKAALHNDFNIYDTVLLIHSEQRSQELEKYQKDGYIGVYWWSHAIIALDWFRYAGEDPELDKKKEIYYDFLIYNRAWSGTREYRLKFAEGLIESDLIDVCNTKFNPLDGEHYTKHCFQNKKLQLHRNDIEDYFELNCHDSTSSADYCIRDYQTAGIEVVLETLFDDCRLHLTEKTLRPIACGQPFILAATCGSLEYLRRYGFETFDGLINEEYDAIEDPAERLQAIIKELKRISDLPEQQKQDLFLKIHEIAARNKQRFFSRKFFDFCVNEFKQNAAHGMNLLKTGPKGTRRQRAFDLMQKKYSAQLDEFLRSRPEVRERINKLNNTYFALDRQPEPNALAHQRSANGTNSN